MALSSKNPNRRAQDVVAQKTQDGQIKCLSCGKPKARRISSGLHCDYCGHEWTFQVELDSVPYIKTVLRRPIIEAPIEAPRSKSKE